MKGRILRFIGGFLASLIIMTIFLASNYFGLARAGRKTIPMEANDLIYILGSCLIMGLIFIFLPKNQGEK